MSMAINRAKYTGDPGFFDFLKKAATIGTSFIPFVGPTVSQAISRIGRQPPRPVAGPGSIPLAPAGHRHIVELGHHDPGDPLTRGQFPMQAFAPRNGATFPQVPIPGPVGALQRAIPFGATGMMAAPQMNGMGKMGGYHPNKSSYFLKSGEFVPEGTRWVKNRKRNPANARATSRAISRIVGAKTYSKSLSRVSIRKKKC